MTYSPITDLFGYVFIISFLCLIVGLARPKTFLKLFKEKNSRKKIGSFFGCASLLFFILLGALIDSDSVDQSEGNSQNNIVAEQKEESKVPEEAQKQESATNQEAVTNTEPDKIVTSVPKYDIMNELSIRYDGGKSFYVLIDPVNLENADFKDGVKMIVKKIVSEKGNKISIDILDDKATMDLYYRSHYASNQLGRILTQSELDQIGIHFIANYSGDLETGIYRNDLYYFPGAFKDNAKVGKYIEDIEFNAAV